MRPFEFRPAKHESAVRVSLLEKSVERVDFAPTRPRALKQKRRRAGGRVANISFDSEGPGADADVFNGASECQFIRQSPISVRMLITATIEANRAWAQLEWKARMIVGRWCDNRGPRDGPDRLATELDAS